jgi:hypothetical protein
MENIPVTPQAHRNYRWPRYVLGGVILAIVLAVIWMSYEIKRTRALRELNSPSNTNGTMF